MGISEAVSEHEVHSSWKSSLLRGYKKHHSICGESSAVSLHQPLLREEVGLGVLLCVPSAGRWGGRLWIWWDVLGAWRVRAAGTGPPTATCVGVIVSASPGPGVALAGRGTSLELWPPLKGTVRGELVDWVSGTGSIIHRTGFEGSPWSPYRSTHESQRVRSGYLLVQRVQNLCTGEE